MIDNPLIPFVIGIVAVVLLLVWLDLPAFIGLILASFIVGLVAPEVPLAKIGSLTGSAFGDNMAGIGIPILMAAVIGKSMLESGAADRIVRGFRSLIGEDNGDFALWGSSSFLAIPVFFDNVFYLMAPLARTMRARVGTNYALYIVVVGAGAATTHVFVPPTPGPLAVASKLDANLGATILVGLMVAIPSALVAGILYGRWLNNRLDIPLRDSMGTTTEDLEEIVGQSKSQLPSALEASLPIVLAIVLVASSTIVNTFTNYYIPFTNVTFGTFKPITDFIGNPNFSLTMAALAASYTFYRMSDISRKSWSDEITEALKNGGNIAAITSAGGAFGFMLQKAGIGSYIAHSLQGIGIGILISAWLIAATIRIAQGSATVAMITTAGIMAPLTGQLGVNPAYLVMAIGAGGNICSWYNDSGFWLVKEIGGLTQKETLKTWTVLTTIISITGISVVLAVSSVLPLA